MKWPADQVEIMRSGFEQWLKDYPALDKLKEWFASDTKQAIYGTAQQVVYDLQYDDNHPAYTSGTWDDGTERKARVRKVAYEPSFVLYPKGCNDDHRYTMLKYVAKQVGLLDTN